MTSARRSLLAPEQVGNRPPQEGWVISEQSNGPVALLAEQPAHAAAVMAMVNGEQEFLPRTAMRRGLILAADGTHPALLGEQPVVLLDRQAVEGTQVIRAPRRILALRVVPEPLHGPSRTARLAVAAVDRVLGLCRLARQAELPERLRLATPAAGLDLVTRVRLTSLLARAWHVIRLIMSRPAFLAPGIAAMFATCRLAEAVKGFYLVALGAPPGVFRVSHVPILAVFPQGGQ